ncbi:hypothetical protein [Nannocystis bainbridge]|uniref:Uncharacterized protein n=1 Tax=Nannocystis bainbridge TaxID=2995303 RepID=A0ABT5E8P4_9BACT|nr:hypothetical protein [Nannocystis bainbridge]MDC0722231.1 hypothetical protein [Nannocystis bainbridge]
MRSSVLSSLACMAVLALPGLAHANVGVAFVHGTGKQTNALADYWTAPFVDSVRQGLPNPSNYVVINCDFEQYMFDPEAAGCLAGQLTSFINTKKITSMVVITHSNGGNVIRWILSNPTYDSRYPKIINTIRWVDALAPSSLGTPLADAVTAGNSFEKSLGWLLGYKSEAVTMQQTSHMAFYNSNYLYGTAGRPALPRELWSIVGTDVDSSPLDNDSYCGGYSLNVGLETTQNWLDACSDGFLECSSQAGAGYVWFYDTEFAIGGEPLSHAQSRRNCFGLDVVLRNDV